MLQSYLSACKINLGLEILSKRDDGYHNVNTVLYKLSEPHDELVVEEAESFRFTTSDHNIPNDENNIVVKAIAICAELYRLKMPGLHIHLRKHIPSGAGLGGGSANAATAIKIFHDHCKQIPKDQQHKIAAKLGADVPFFLEETNVMVASGIGEKLTPIELKINFPILIVKLHNTFISTAKAYSMLRLKERSTPTNYAAVFRNIPEPSSWKEAVTNDFEEVAFALHPILFSLKRSLYSLGADFALMSGSGSAFYGIFKDHKTAAHAHEKLLIEFPSSLMYLSH